MTREEAINKVRQMSLPKETMEILEALAPELAESEDERMIREIKRYIKEQGDKPNGLPNGTVAVADMIAWLEKRGGRDIDCPQKHQDNSQPNGCIVLEDFNGGEGFYKLNLDYLNKKQVEEVEEMVRTWNKESKASNENIKACIGMCLTDANEQRFKDYNTSLKDCLAYLEEQKEYISNNFDDVWDEEDCEEIITEGQKLTPRFKELLKEVCHAWYDRGAKLEKQKEQKHPNGCFTCDEYKKGYEEGRRNGFTAGYNKAMKEVEQKEQKPSGETNVEPDSKIPREEYLYHLLANHIITFTDYTYLLAKKPFDYECANIPQKDYTPVEQKSELSEEDEEMIYSLRSFLIQAEQSGRYGSIQIAQIEQCLNWLKSLPLNLKKKNEDVAKLCSNEWSEEDKQNLSVCLTYIKDTQLRDWLIEAFHKSSEWSEEDEKILKLLILNIGRYKYFGGMSSERILAFLKSLRPQPHKEVYQAAKHDLAIKFMNYLDENRPEGKMSLSNGECEDIDKAFKENDWAKIMRYVEKYRPSWKPSEQEKGALRTAIHILTEERNFPKAAAQLQNILDAFEGKESRKDFKPNKEQMEALEWLVEYVSPSEKYIVVIKNLYEQLKKL